MRTGGWWTKGHEPRELTEATGIGRRSRGSPIRGGKTGRRLPAGAQGHSAVGRQWLAWCGARGGRRRPRSPRVLPQHPAGTVGPEEDRLVRERG